MISYINISYQFIYAHVYSLVNSYPYVDDGGNLKVHWRPIGVILVNVTRGLPSTESLNREVGRRPLFLNTTKAATKFPLNHHSQEWIHNSPFTTHFLISVHGFSFSSLKPSEIFDVYDYVPVCYVADSLLREYQTSLGRNDKWWKGYILAFYAFRKINCQCVNIKHTLQI